MYIVPIFLPFYSYKQKNASEKLCEIHGNNASKKEEKNWFAKLCAGNFEIKGTPPLGRYTEIRPNSGSGQVKPTLHDAKHCKNIKD